MNKNNESPKAGIYMLLLAIQIFGAILFVWQQLPSFRQIAGNPGEQLPYDAFGDLDGRHFVHNANLVLVPSAIFQSRFDVRTYS
jgi:hypothetical protein